MPINLKKKHFNNINKQDFFLHFKNTSLLFVNQIISGTFALLFEGKQKLFTRTKTKSVIMNTLSYKTASANKATVNKEWVLVDADGQTLGRLASKVAKLIRGKYKPNYTPHVDCGDNVVIINAEKINLSGKKWTDKSYIRHTGYPGGQRSLTATEMFEKDPTRLVEKAVKGMLPKNKLGSALFRNLYVYAGSEHKQEAQSPKAINLNDLK
jgi:large subunit ribosomal protein L13